MRGRDRARAGVGAATNTARHTTRTADSKHGTRYMGRGTRDRRAGPHITNNTQHTIHLEFHATHYAFLYELVDPHACAQELCGRCGVAC